MIDHYRKKIDCKLNMNQIRRCVENQSLFSNRYWSDIFQQEDFYQDSFLFLRDILEQCVDSDFKNQFNINVFYFYHN